jgi:outer membrane protein TolC
VANQDLKAAEAHLREARDIVKLARADLFPTIGVGSNVASLKDSSNEPYTPSRNLRATGEFLLTKIDLRDDTIPGAIRLE